MVATTNPIVFEALKRSIKLMQQLHEAKYYVDGALERCHPELLTSMEGLYDFLLYFRGAVSAYGKCFVSSTGHRKLDRDTLFKNRDELLNLHEGIMDLRHKYVAHSADNEIDSVDVVVTETDADIHLAMNYHTSFPYDRLYELRSLIKHVTDFTVDEQTRQIGRASQAAGKPVTVGPPAADDGEEGGTDRGSAGVH